MSDFRAFHTEHQAYDWWIDGDRAREVRLFRSAPNRDDPRYDGTLYEVAWADVRSGDVLFALLVNESSKPACIPLLQFWRVLEVRDELIHALVNNVSGAASDGEYLHDRMCGLLPPVLADDWLIS